MNATQIKEAGKIIMNTALEQVARELGTDTASIVDLMHSNEKVAKRVGEYVRIGFDHMLKAAA